MHIFIDESGTFVLGAANSRFSCIGVLVIPSVSIDAANTVMRDFKMDRGVGDGAEIKGHRLSEEDVAELIHALSELDVFFEVSAFDSVAQSASALHTHKMQTAAGMTSSLSGTEAQEVRDRHEALRHELERMPDQLYAQAALTPMLLHRVIARAITYYVQRRPDELASFIWQHDPKEGSTPQRQFGSYDQFFAAVVKPWIQHLSITDPALFLQGADYSHFQPYLADVLAHLRAEISGGTVRRAPFVYNLNLLLGNLSFPRSETSLGLQLVDILTNAVKRRLNGNLQSAATGNLPLLMVQPLRDGHTIWPTILGHGLNKKLSDVRAENFIRHCDHYAKRLLKD